MTESTPSLATLRARVRGATDAGQAISRLAFVAVKRGVVPSGLSGLGILVREGRRDLHWKVLGDALARIFEDAGPLAAKVGQILATRADLLPAPLCARLEVLLEKQRPLSEARLRRALADAYGPALPFAHVEATPLGAGSVGQVHRAKLADGRAVVVKVLRPGVREAIEKDLRGARALIPLAAKLARGESATARRLLDRALDDLAAGFRREVDLLAEAAALAEFRARIRDRNPRVVVPFCHRELCRPTVLVMEALDGVSLATFRERAKTDPEAARRIASLALKEILQQVFEDGRFHADPHAGNLLVLADGRLGIVDLGLTAEFGEAERKSVTNAIRAFLARDPESVIRALLALGSTPPGFAFEAFQRDVLDAVGRSREPSVAACPDEPTRLERLVADLLSLARHHELEIPASTTLLVKSLVTIEGVARSLDPDLDLRRAALPVVLGALRPRWLERVAFWRRRPAPE